MRWGGVPRIVYCTARAVAAGEELLTDCALAPRPFARSPPRLPTLALGLTLAGYACLLLWSHVLTIATTSLTLSSDGNDFWEQYSAEQRVSQQREQLAAKARRAEEVSAEYSTVGY